MINLSTNNINDAVMRSVIIGNNDYLLTPHLDRWVLPGQFPYNKNEEKQLKELYSFVKKWNGKGKNLVLITHYSIITAATTAVPSSGEMVITDKNFKVLGTIQTD